MTTADPRETTGSPNDGLAGMFADLITSINLSGREIARLAGTRPQYISDIKRRQRPLSRGMYMRTLVGLFGSYKWLISGDLRVDTERIIALYPAIAASGGPLLPLPVFQRPFMGPKMMVDDWDGAFYSVPSPVKEEAGAMVNPYILHLPFDDKSGRLRKGDYLLVNQTDSTEAGYVLVKSGWGVKLMRRVADGFVDVENGDRHTDPGENILGTVVLLLMGVL